MKKFLFLISLLIMVFSCDDIIEVEDISNRNLEILAPTNNSVIETTIVNFSWNTVEDAENYKLQIATANFENATQIIADSLMGVTTFTITLTPGDYQWRVKAINSDYQTEYITNGFTVAE